LSLAIQTQNNFQFCEICGYKTRYDNNFFSPLSFVAVLDPGTGIWDKHPGSATLVAGTVLWIPAFYLNADPDPA
jgi:hypothetical protein